MKAMKILSINTQKAYQPGLLPFLDHVICSEMYDAILLQEAVEPVLAPLRTHTTYAILEAFNEEMAAASHLAILYRSSWTLSSSQLYSFGMLHPFAALQHAGFGLLRGTFDTPSGSVMMGSVHLHSGWLPQVRVQEVRALKTCLMQDQEADVPVIVGGDFNLGLPGEVSNGYRLLAPQFCSRTRTLGSTLDSRYSEPHHNIINTGAVFLARFGLGVRLKTDHFFVDAKTAERVVGERVLPDRISDHSPIELELATHMQASPVY